MVQISASYNYSTFQCLFFGKNVTGVIRFYFFADMKSARHPDHEASLYEVTPPSTALDLLHLLHPLIKHLLYKFCV